MVVIAKTAKWMLFGVVGSLLPLILNYIVTIPPRYSFDPAHVINHGELCIVIAAMCSVSIGELIGTRTRFVLSSIISAAATVLFLMIATGLFAYIPANRDLPEEYIAVVSYILFVLAFISSMLCIAFSVEVEQ
jgi:hypothetical protein